MTDQVIFPQDQLDVEVCDAIADLIAFGRNKDFYSCSYQTSEGNLVQVVQEYTADGGREATSYRVTVWANAEQSEARDIILRISLREDGLDTLFSFKDRSQAIAEARRNLDKKDTALAKEELDLERRITACVQTLCLSKEGR